MILGATSNLQSFYDLILCFHVCSKGQGKRIHLGGLDRSYQMLQNCAQVSKYLHMIKCMQRPSQDMFQFQFALSKQFHVNQKAANAGPFCNV